MLIKSSGSAFGQKLERICSGQSYLYQKDGMESEVVEYASAIRKKLFNHAAFRAGKEDQGTLLLKKKYWQN